MTKNELNVVKEAWLEVLAAVQPMLPAEHLQPIIGNHVRRAERLLGALVEIEERFPKGEDKIRCNNP